MATFDVLLPVKNGITYLAESIDSIIAQTVRDWRLIVLDHGSTDGSLELAKRYAETDSRIVVHSRPEAVGLAGLLNYGLDQCDCEYVLRQDADDVSMPDRMATLASAFKDNASLVVLGSLGDVIDAHGKKIGNIDMPTEPEGIASIALFRTPICHPSVAIRLKTMQYLGRNNGTAVRYGVDFLGAIPESRRLIMPGLAEDYFMFGQLALIAPCRNLAQSLIKYRWHSTNVGATKHLAQMQAALNISRYLAESLSLLKGVAHLDPAPFCNHGESLLAIEGQTDFSAEYGVLRQILLKTIPDSKELARELAFRKVISVRSIGLMSSRFASFAMRYRIRPSEMNTVRSWVLRGVRKRPLLQLKTSGVIS